MPLLGQVDQLEVARERPCHLLRPFDRPRSDELSRRTVVLSALARRDHRAPQLLDIFEEVGAGVLRQHLPEHVAEEADLPPQGGRHLNPRDFTRLHGRLILRPAGLRQLAPVCANICSLCRGYLTLTSWASTEPTRRRWSSTSTAPSPRSSSSTTPACAAGRSPSPRTPRTQLRSCPPPGRRATSASRPA